MCGLLKAWERLPDAERRARLRCLATAVRIFAGPAGRELGEALQRAEADASLLVRCDELLGRLPTRPYRNALATLAAVTPPTVEAGR